MGGPTGEKMGIERPSAPGLMDNTREIRRRISLVLAAALLIALVSGCADIEAPVREFPAARWSSHRSATIDPDWEVTPPGTVEVLIIERGSGKGTFGHAALHIGRHAYSWDYGGGYILVRQSFRSFLYRYTYKENRSLKGIMIEYPEEGIKQLVWNLDEEFRIAWNEGLTHGSFFLTNNCSTILYRALLKTSGKKGAGWPPTILPSWMGKNVQRTFGVLHYRIYEKANH